MKAQIRHIGSGRSPILILDDLTGRPDAIVDIAAALAPFPPSRNYYPGLRRIITEADGAASRYLDVALQRIAPSLGRAFGTGGFRPIEASFSMVVASPGDLTAQQRAPHFDSLDPGYIAILHYLSDCAGTAFYRQRATGIERLDADNQPRFREAWRDRRETDGYITGSDADYEEIGRVEGRRDRAIVYHGTLLHSGIIDAAQVLDTDPRRGRLTANIFVALQ